MAELHAVRDATEEATHAHDAERQTVATTYDRLHVLKGRLAHERAALRRVARSARRNDRDVPALTRTSKRRAAKTPPDTTAPSAKPVTLVAPVAPAPEATKTPGVV